MDNPAFIFTFNFIHPLHHRKRNAGYFH
jgi:hypothetical protein